MATCATRAHGRASACGNRHTEQVIAAITSERPKVARYRSWGWDPTTTKKRENADTQAGSTERIAAGFDRAAVRARGVHHLRELAILFSDHRRSRNRVHAHPRTGDGALRRRWRARLRSHGAGLDCWTIEWPGQDCSGGVYRGS